MHQARRGAFGTMLIRPAGQSWGFEVTLNPNGEASLHLLSACFNLVISTVPFISPLLLNYHFLRLTDPLPSFSLFSSFHFSHLPYLTPGQGASGESARRHQGGPDEGRVHRIGQEVDGSGGRNRDRISYLTIL
jgi:hypothetical protein